MPPPADPTHTVEVTCPGCFHPQQWDANGACPVCHHRATAEGRSGALLPVGTQLKGYVIGEKLGQGGFGITYRGFDLTLKMKVAIKEYYPSEMVGRSTNRKAVVLNGQDHEDLFQYGLKTFLKEAQTIAQLRHPHLVRVLNYFELNETAYLVMDYLEGEDLAKHLKPPKGQRGIRMPWRRAVKLLLPVLDGLQKVHQAGFMHRDLKPGNLYLTHDDELIVLDFGSARQVTGSHTRSLLIFSEGYAPYEQYLQGHLNRQGLWTDVYAIAATLYFMLTGCRLPSAMERKQAELLQQPDPLKPARHFVPELPPTLDVALIRALVVEPEQRLQSISAFKQHLEAALVEEEKTLEVLPKPTVAPEPATTPLLQLPPKPKAPPEPPKPEPAPKPPEPPPKPKTVPKPPKPAVVAESAAKPHWGLLIVAIMVVGLTWRIIDSLLKPAIPPVVASTAIPAVATPPVVTLPALNPDRVYLTMTTTPATAQIRIMNIGPPYQDGIELVPGNFDIEVSAPGYQTYRSWYSLVAGVRKLAVVLQPEVSTPPAPPVVASAPDPKSAARLEQFELQLSVVKKLLETRKIKSARQALSDAKKWDQDELIEVFRQQQTKVFLSTALTFLEQGEKAFAAQVLRDLNEWDPQSPEYRILRDRLQGR